MHASGIRLVTIVKEDLPGEIAEFQAKAWPEAEVFVDDSRSMYRLASNGQLVKPGGGSLCVWLCKVVCCNRSQGRALKEANKQYDNNFVGEGLILGSVLVVDTAGSIIYAHAEQAFDDHPNFDDVVQAAVAAALASSPGPPPALP